MLNEVAKKWVSALRSGEYKQGTGRLKDGDTYCCLGVLVDLYHKEHPGALDKEEWENGGLAYLVDSEEGDALELPPTIQEWVGLKSTYGCRDYASQIDLTYLNDKEGYTFNQIADIIEAHADDLFVS